MIMQNICFGVVLCGLVFLFVIFISSPAIADQDTESDVSKGFSAVSPQKRTSVSKYLSNQSSVEAANRARVCTGFQKRGSDVMLNPQPLPPKPDPKNVMNQ